MAKNDPESNFTRLLLVEDDEDTGRALSRMLRQLNYDVVLAKTVKVAIAAINTSRFDVLLSDIGLPDGTGREVMRHAHHQQALPGVALTALSRAQDLEANSQAGFTQTLIKPAMIGEILRALQNCMEGRCGAAEDISAGRPTVTPNVVHSGKVWSATAV